MIIYLPSRRILIVAGALAAGGAIAGLVDVFWQTILTWVMIAAVARLAWRMLAGPSRHREHWLVRLFEAGAVVFGLRTAHRAVASRRVEDRREELHSARLETEKARAEELRSRAEHRKRTRAEQDKAERAAYWRGAADASR